MDDAATTPAMPASSRPPRAPDSPRKPAAAPVSRCDEEAGATPAALPGAAAAADAMARFVATPATNAAVGGRTPVELPSARVHGHRVHHHHVRALVRRVGAFPLTESLLHAEARTTRSH